MKPIMTVDPETDAIYLRVSDGTIVDTIEVHPCVALDLDDRKMVVGIEYIPKEVARKDEYQFATPEEKARWEEDKRFMDEGWEGPKGDLSKTDLKIVR